MIKNHPSSASLQVSEELAYSEEDDISSQYPAFIFISSTLPNISYFQSNGKQIQREWVVNVTDNFFLWRQY